MKKKLFLEIISFLFVLLYSYAALSKLLDFEQFRVQIGQSPILTPFAGWVSWTVPSAELLISVLLVFPPTRLIGLYASFSLMVMFTTYIFLIQHFSEVVPCSCGGILQSMGWTTHFFFNLFFILLALWGILKSSKPASPGENKPDQMLLLQ
jgi:hypothetical protein